MRVLLAVVMLGVVVGGGGRRSAAEEDPGAPPPLADRAKILGVELRRGPAADLAPYLEADAHWVLRNQAIRALGRIGDRAGAPALLAQGLKAGGTDLLGYLEAAGLSAAKSLEAEVRPHTESKDREVATAALEALGWIGGDSAIATLASALHHPYWRVIVAALEGLARAKAEACLERVATFLRHPDTEVRQAAWFATWLLAGARRKAATSLGGSWHGEARLALELSPWLEGPEPPLLDAVRPFGVLAPQLHAFQGIGPVPDETEVKALDVLPAVLKAQDERVLQELMSRVLATRQGPQVEHAILDLLRRADAKSRQAGVEAAAGQERSPAVVEALRARVPTEPDARVREALAVALCKLGDESAAKAILERKDRPEDPTLRLLTELRVLAASKRETALQELCDLARSQAYPAAMLEALSLLEEHPGEPVAKFVGEALGHPDPYVRAAAVGLVGKYKLVSPLPALDGLMEACRGHAERDIRQAVIEAWTELLKQSAVEGAAASRLRERIAEAALSDPAFTARAAARDAMKTLDIPGAPSEDPLQPNDWAGLPRPKGPILGVDLSKGEGPLTEAEILTLADRMQVEQPEFVVENDVGSFRLAIDPTEAPVHAVSFLLCVASGVYEKTLWHRVVPSFVIQGGDPHGTGNGDAGWSLPDEITRGRFVRGALGMPKGAIRDTGGCQLFVMHSDYRPLDGRYTCYGRVVDGMDTVDRIRVGDRTEKVSMVLK
jgi:cyclophilin family peptidyl-prolyl cis-trans isomerase/HEAT repeat protein